MNSFEERSALHQFTSPKLDPCIFYSHGKVNREHTFYSLSKRLVYNKHIKEMVHNDLLCCLHGWLILSNQIDRGSCQLFDPVSEATIQLPLLPRPNYDSCTLSCDPNNPNCIVMLIKAEEGMATCYFCRPSDVAWTEKHLELEKMKLSSGYYFDGISAVGCYKDQICIFTHHEKILLLVADPPYLTIKDLGVEPIIYDIYHYDMRQTYLVESDGELFLIRKFDLRIDVYDFVVYKLEISENRKRWVVVENLGGRSFFLSSLSSGITCFSENYGIKPNTIYFTQPSDPRIYSFDLLKKVLTFLLPCPNVKRNLVHAEWILLLSPNPLCKLDGEVHVIAPLQITKSRMLPPPVSTSIGKDCSHNDTSNSVAKKLYSTFVGNDWSELPNDALISIAQKLSCVSCARIATVCKSWRSAITWAPKNLHGCPTFLHMPSSSIEVFHFMNKSRYNIFVPENPKVLSIQHANHGWLLMNRYGGMEIFFLNLLITEKIEIPYLPFQIHGCCFTSFPTSSNCSILCISHSFIYHICRGVMDWSLVQVPEFEAIIGDFELPPYSNLVFHNELFYWIWGCGSLCTYNSTEEKVEFLVEPRSPCETVCINYLFKSGEKLMSLWAEKHEKWVRVYELDEASMARKEVNTLGKKVVFLSRYSSLVTKMQHMEDMIYFNRFVGNNQPLMYSLKTGELRAYGGRHHIIRDFCDIPEYQIKSAWIEPNVRQHSARELNWYDVF